MTARYRDKIVRNLLERGDAPCMLSDFVSWACMQGIVMTTCARSDAADSFFYVCPMRRCFIVDGRPVHFKEIDSETIRVHARFVQYRGKKARSGLVAIIAALGGSCPAPRVDYWQSWARACDVVVTAAYTAISDKPVSAFEVLAASGAAYAQPIDTRSDYEIVQVRRALFKAKQIGYEALWWIQMVPTGGIEMVVYGQHGFRYYRLLIHRRDQFFMWPRLSIGGDSALVRANNHVARMTGCESVLPYIPYERLTAFLKHVPSRLLPVLLHETTRLDAWRGVSCMLPTQDIAPALLSFRGDLTFPSRFPAADGTMYVHAMLRVASATNGKLWFGAKVAEGGQQMHISCTMELPRCPGRSAWHAGDGFVARSISRSVRSKSSAFIEVGVIVAPSLAFAICGDPGVGSIDSRVTWAPMGTPTKTCHVRAATNTIIVGGFPGKNGVYEVFTY